jgi:Flp pilus assembly protein protease CpaA
MTDRLKLAIRNNQHKVYTPSGDTRRALRKSRNTWRGIAVALAVLLAAQSYNWVMECGV